MKRITFLAAIMCLTIASRAQIMNSTVEGHKVTVVEKYDGAGKLIDWSVLVMDDVKKADTFYYVNKDMVKYYPGYDYYQDPANWSMGMKINDENTNPIVKKNPAVVVTDGSQKNPIITSRNENSVTDNQNTSVANNNSSHKLTRRELKQQRKAERRAAKDEASNKRAILQTNRTSSVEGNPDNSNNRVITTGINTTFGSGTTSGIFTKDLDGNAVNIIEKDKGSRNSIFIVQVIRDGKVISEHSYSKRRFQTPEMLYDGISNYYSRYGNFNYPSNGSVNGMAARNQLITLPNGQTYNPFDGGITGGNAITLDGGGNTLRNKILNPGGWLRYLIEKRKHQ